MNFIRTNLKSISIVSVILIVSILIGFLYINSEEKIILSNETSKSILGYTSKEFNSLIDQILWINGKYTSSVVNQNDELEIKLTKLQKIQWKQEIKRLINTTINNSKKQNIDIQISDNNSSISIRSEKSNSEMLAFIVPYVSSNCGLLQVLDSDSSDNWAVKVNVFNLDNHKVVWSGEVNNAFDLSLISNFTPDKW